MPSADSIAAALAHQGLAELLRQDPLAPSKARAEAAGGAWRVVVTVEPTQAGPDLSPCERDVLALLATARCRYATPRILRELEAQEKLWGESTVKHALSRLHNELRLVGNSKKAPRGYWLVRPLATGQAG